MCVFVAHVCLHAFVVVVFLFVTGMKDLIFLIWEQFKA